MGKRLTSAGFGLPSYWELREPFVLGLLISHGLNPELKALWWIHAPFSLEGQRLEYQLRKGYDVVSLHSGGEHERRGIYVGSDRAAQGLQSESIIIAEIGASHQSIRDSKHPDLVQATGTLRRASHEEEETYFAMRDLADIREDILLEQRRKDSLQAELAEWETHAQEARRLEAARSELSVELEQSRSQRDSLNLDALNLRSDISALEAVANERRQKVVQLDSEINAAQERNGELEAEILDKERMIMHLDRSMEELRQRADVLCRLGLLSEEAAQLLKPSNGMRNIPAHASFAKACEGDFRRLVNRIQKSAHRRGYLYPRSILACFIALLRSHDLIVLAGLSGSGKSALVREVAHAIGGEARIVPVKPNWTSSQDLLGFYNPMERCYIRSEFLDVLIEAEQNPDKLYLVCLDEMNLAHVEYYLADLLSVLEDRGEKAQPGISLFSPAETSHAISEMRDVLPIIERAARKSLEGDGQSLGALLSQPSVTEELKIILGDRAVDNILSISTQLRRTLSGLATVRHTMPFPPNVRLLGTVNMDETTHTLSPKVLDRGHVLRFTSPLHRAYRTSVRDEMQENPESGEDPIYISPEELGPTRGPYPEYQPEDPLVSRLEELATSHLEKMGVEIGFRTIRQSLHFRNLFRECWQGGGNGQELPWEIALNAILRQKVLPRIRLERRGKERDFKEFLDSVRSMIPADFQGLPHPTALEELEGMDKRGESQRMYNYWI